MIAWKLLLNCSNDLQQAETYREDLAAVTAQALGDTAYTLHLEIVEVFNVTKNVTRFATLSDRFLELVKDLDEVMGSVESQLLGQWLSNARGWGTTTAESNLYEWNARTQITVWGRRSSSLSGYAYKLWSGLVEDFYLPRWSLWLHKLRQSLDNNTPFDQHAFDEEVKTFEESWTQETKPYPTNPQGNTIDISRALYEKYANYNSVL